MPAFDYSSHRAHPRICYKLISKFAREVVDLQNRNLYLERSTDGFCVMITPAAIYLGIDYSDLRGLTQTEFNHYVWLHSHKARGFSNITIAILHEMGHIATKGHAPESYDRVKEIRKIEIECGNNLRKANQAYFRLPDEELATAWALRWLENPENRKIAKKFEKEFFKAWRG